MNKIKLLTSIGISLSAEDDKDKLLEMILLGAKALTHANAGTLYIVEDDRQLKIETLFNDNLKLAYGGTSGVPVPFAPIQLWIDDKPNLASVVTYAIHAKKTISIADAYHEKGFDFSNTRAMDNKTGYHSQSFLTIPLEDHTHCVIGVLQLINCQDSKNNIIPFDSASQELAESLAAQAAIILTNKRLLIEQQRLFEDFIQLIAKAIDSKSPYTGGHCSRVPVLALMLADAVNADQSTDFGNFKFTPEEMYELKIASWLHDCGKVTTPEYIMDKATKLEAITDGIKLIDLRVEMLHLQKRFELEIGKCTLEEYMRFSNTLTDNIKFLHHVNIGGESLLPSDIERIQDIANTYIVQYQNGESRALLSQDEIKNLQIQRGTLNEKERSAINNHVVMTLEMLNSLHYPENLKNVPEIAGSHHERIDGKGYPRKLIGEQMSLQARIVAIADVFEALTAADRPYKQAKSLRESLQILADMCQAGHIDAKLFNVFMQSKIYAKYASQFLKPEQIDEI